ncbi:group II intron maturase-specific domain-containing protein [Rhodococcus sp. NPDC059968]|uniref:group II intron maturase-specific domain-containing protein n=1 Tax=Rhodococcus sp. NPDC059968 TaxID=3347017 RepID=UPI003671054A
MFSAFLPAMGADALKAKSAEVKGWRIHMRTALDLAELAGWMNPIIRGWMTYYGKFYRSEIYVPLRRINTYLVRWARRNFKRLRSFKRAERWWKGMLRRQPRLFAHWTGWPIFNGSGEKSRVTGDC